MHGLPPGQFRFVPVSDLGSGGLGHVDEIEIVASSEQDDRQPVGAQAPERALERSPRRAEALRA